MSTAPVEVGRVRKRYRVLGDPVLANSGWTETTVGPPNEIEDIDGVDLAGPGGAARYHRYFLIPLPSRDGVISRIHLVADGDVDLEFLDYNGPVPRQEGPHSVWFESFTIAGPGFTIARRDSSVANSHLPAPYQLQPANDLYFSASLMWCRVNAANFTTTVNFTVIFNPAN